MAVYGDKSYTNFTGVNLKNTAAIRLELDGGFAGTISVKPSPDASRAWTLPDKTGTFPIMGTFNVQLPAATTAFFSTAVTVSGIRSEDAIIVTLGERIGTSGYVFGTQGTAYFLQRAQPGAGVINLFFQNPGNATGYIELTGNYVAMR